MQKLIFNTFLMLLCLSAQFVTAQKKGHAIDLVQTGNQLFDKEQYYKAATYYAQAATIDKNSAYINYQLGECYRLVFNYEKAESYYFEAGKKDKKNFPFALYYYPLMQKLNGNFKAAIVNFDLFISAIETLNGKSQEKIFFLEKAKIERKGCIYAIQKLSSPIGDYKFENLGNIINSPFNDYAPALQHDDSSLYFTSARSGSTGNHIDNRFGEAFSDIYRYRLGATWQPEVIEDNFKVINTEFSDGAGIFNRAKDKFYYTSCREGGAFCKIYVTRLKNGIWQSPMLLNDNINLKNFENKQPTLSAGGDTLFFVSNRPGGQGMNDIWMSITSGDETWGKAMNLGNKINTPYNEIAPFYYPADRILFFSSDGHEGFGGLDIFMSIGEAYSEALVKNLGVPFNSNHDDAYITLGVEKGYLSSNRDGGEGKFDIYRFNIITNEIVIAEIDHNTANTSKDEVLKSRVRKLNQSNLYAMRDEDKIYYENLASSHKTRIDRIVTAKLEALKSMQSVQLRSDDEAFYNALDVKEKATIEKLVKILWANNRNNISEAIASITNESPAMANSTLLVTGNLVRLRDSSAAAAVSIPMVNDKGEILRTTSTNDDGSFKFTNIPVNQKFKILADNVSIKFTQPAEYEVQNLQIETIIKELIVVHKENIYFDHNSYNIRHEAARMLDEIVVFYGNNPQIQIEIFAYTDNTGTDIYNEALSQMRGQSTMDYLVAKGVDRTALVILAQGRRKPFASNDDEIGRQLNRRVEFSFNGNLSSFNTGAETYLLKRACTLAELVTATGLTLEDLEKWNGFVTSDLLENTPLRLKNPKKDYDRELLYRVNLQDANTNQE